MNTTHTFPIVQSGQELSLDFLLLSQSHFHIMDRKTHSLLSILTPHS